MTLKQIAIFESWPISMPHFWTYNSSQVMQGKEDWNPLNTTINYAKIRVVARTDFDQLGFTFRFNNVEVLWIGPNQAVDWDSSGQAMTEQDVTALFAPGSYYGQGSIWSSMGAVIGWPTVTFSAYLIYDYTGEVPIPTPPTPGIQLEWWQWLMIGGFAIAGLYIIAPKGALPSPTRIIKVGAGATRRAASYARPRAGKAVAYARRKYAERKG